MQTDDLKGIWNIPDNTNQWVSGVYNFNEGNSSLKLNGNFGIEDGLLFATIHGVDFNGNKITMFDSWLAYVDYFSELDCDTYFQSYSIIGGHYESEDKLLIKELDFEINELYSWLESDLLIECSTKDLKITSPPDKYKDICLGFGILKVYFEFVDNSVLNKVDVLWKPRIKLIFNDLVTFNNFISIPDRLNKYFAFVTGTFIDINKIKCKDSDDKELLILIGQTINTSSRYRDIGLSYSQLEGILEISLNNWFTNYDDLMPVISIYLDDYRFMDKKRFLDLIRAVESLARLKNIGQGKFEELLELDKNKLDAILSNITNEMDRDWLKSKISFLGEPTLRARLIELINKIPGLELPSRKQKSIISKIIDTRNYLVHLDLFKKNKCLEKFFTANYILELMIFLEISEMLEIRKIIEEHQEVVQRKIKKINTFLKEEL